MRDHDPEASPLALDHMKIVLYTDIACPKIPVSKGKEEDNFYTIHKQFAYYMFFFACFDWNEDVACYFAKIQTYCKSTAKSTAMSGDFMSIFVGDLHISWGFSEGSPNWIGLNGTSEHRMDQSRE